MSLETPGREREGFMQISFGRELAHSMAVMLLELQAELDEFAYQHDHQVEPVEPLTGKLLGTSAQV